MHTNNQSIDNKIRAPGIFTCSNVKSTCIPCTYRHRVRRHQLACVWFLRSIGTRKKTTAKAKDKRTNEQNINKNHRLRLHRSKNKDTQTKRTEQDEVDAKKNTHTTYSNDVSVNKNKRTKQ